MDCSALRTDVLSAPSAQSNSSGSSAADEKRVESAGTGNSGSSSGPVTMITSKAVGVLGDAKFSTVILIELNDKRRALKLYKTTVQQDVEGELRIWQHISDVQGVQPVLGLLTTKLVGFHPDGAVMEYRADGSLERMVRQRAKQQKPLSPAEIVQLVGQIANVHHLLMSSYLVAERNHVVMLQTLNKLHAKHVTHGDVACRNILLDGTTTFLSDFGHALYLPPELKSTEAATEAATEATLADFMRDWQGLGHIILQLAAADVTVKHPALIAVPESLVKLVRAAAHLCENKTNTTQQAFQLVMSATANVQQSLEQVSNKIQT